MKRLFLILAAASMAGIALWNSFPAAVAVEQRPPTGISNAKINPDVLREMLNKGLKVTRDDQKQYIDKVVAQVVADKLPASLVYAAFKYARTRRPQYPFPYFVYSLETLAKRNKIEFSGT